MDIKSGIYTIFVIFLFFSCKKETSNNIIPEKIISNIEYNETTNNINPEVTNIATFNDEDIKPESDLDVFSQTLTQSFPKLMYVTSREGLRERSEPSTGGNILRTLLYREAVQVFFRQANPVTIDGITDYWYSTTSSTVDLRRWIFGGYLSEELPEDLSVITGMWDDIDNRRQYYTFSPDHNYREGYKETDMGVWGKWELHGDTLTLILDSAMNGIIIDPPDIEYVQIIVIDSNNIQLKYSNNEIVKLRRNTSGW
jgi:hypothetical protein